MLILTFSEQSFNVIEIGIRLTFEYKIAAYLLRNMGISDVLIFQVSGLPIVARCYGGNYCKLHPDHSLLTGFLSAINSFSKEIGQEELQAVLFKLISLVFSEGEGIMVVIGVDKDEEIDAIQYFEYADQLRKEFLQQFPKATHELVFMTDNEIDEMSAWLDRYLEMMPMGDLLPMMQTRRKSILSKVKGFLGFK